MVNRYVAVLVKCGIYYSYRELITTGATYFGCENQELV